MSTSRLLRPVAPGGLLSKGADELTAAEELTLQQIAAGDYFKWNIVPTDSGDHQNYTLPVAPNPAGSLNVFVNGQKITPTSDYSVTATALVLVVALAADDIIYVNYTVAP